MNRVYHFEIPAEAPEKVVEFYSKTFGWRVMKKVAPAEGYWFLHTGSSMETGINGGIKKRTTREVGIIPHIEVKSVDATSNLITKLGGKILSQKQLIESTGIILYCQDPNGNTFCIVEKTVPKAAA